MRRTEVREFASARLARRIDIRFAGRGIETAKHGLSHVRYALNKSNGPGSAIQEPHVAIASDVDEALHRSAVPLKVHQNGRRHFVPVERLIGRVLEVTLDLSGGHINGNRRRGVEVVARALITHPRSAVASAPIGQTGFGIVVAGHPHRPSAGLPLLAAFGPRLASRFTRRWNSVGTPQLFPRL